MWMTPFYLFFGTLFFENFRKNIDLKKLKIFFGSIFIFLCFLSLRLIYLGYLLIDETKRTDFPGKEIAQDWFKINGMIILLTISK